MRIMLLAAAGVIMAACVAWGGIEYRKQRVCAGLEDDYLNSVARMRDAAASQAAVARIMRPPSSFDQIIKRESAKMASGLISIDARCGKLASDTAYRKGSEMLH